eukprot:GCRY01001144.1.p1 GENE.GCRY01001144.1~~GCRY01001144.1.p1  ORF type:complete len:155 (-),score=27.83 GCRY01001144.1:220-684(-)
MEEDKKGLMEVDLADSTEAVNSPYQHPAPVPASSLAGENTMKDKVEQQVSSTNESITDTVWQEIVHFGTSVLSVIDFLGEKLANFFGITDSKYKYVLHEYQRAEEERRQRVLEEAQVLEEMEGTLSAENSPNFPEEESAMEEPKSQPSTHAPSI